jgi:AP-4 complex subunit epsilon-1
MFRVMALSLLVNINPSFASEHQLALVECLEDPDETLQKKTLDLLFAMTNSRNVVSITEKMLK